MFKYQGEQISVDSIYRYLDKLHKTQIETAKEISYKHTCKILGDALTVLYYNVTTLYFEPEEEDDLRKRGYNKDGKHQQPQILLGLLVSEGGYPVDYDIFEGDKYEGETLMIVINAFKEKYKLEHLTFAADAGLLSKKNIELLKEPDYQYILGARIKNETEITKKKILELQLTNGQNTAIKLSKEQKLVISSSENRAKKDPYNRQRGITKLEKLIKAEKLTKEQINNKGYNKFLKMSGKINVKLGKEKIKLDAK